MKSILLLANLLILVCVYGQKDLGRVTGYDFFDYDGTVTNLSPKRNEYIRDHKIESKTTLRFVGKFSSKEVQQYDRNGYVTTRTYSSSDGQNTVEVYTYDAQGNTTKRQLSNSKGEVVSTTLYEYNAAGKLTLISDQYRKESVVRRFDYDVNGNRISEYGQDRKGRPYLRKKGYDLITNKILYSELYRKDTLNPLKRLEYEYYENGSKKTIRYFEKGKLSYTWSFDCAEEGQLVDMKKSDSTLVCIKTEKSANGDEIQWRHEFSSNGTPIKIKSVYDSTGKWKEEISYRPDGSIYNHKTFFADGGHLDIYYDKDGQPSYYMESIYNTAGQVVKTSMGSPKSTRHSWYGYDAKGLVVLRTDLDKKHTVVEEYSYTFYE